jgi:hypothetical protein
MVIVTEPAPLSLEILRGPDLTDTISAGFIRI